MIRTDKLWVNGVIHRNSEAYEMLLAFAEKIGVRGAALYHMGLLTEETLGMANQLLKDFEGEIWLEERPEGYGIVLEADLRGNEKGTPEKPASSPEGFMAKIAEMLNCSYMFENISDMPEELAEMLPDYMSYGIRENAGSPVWAGSWSLSSCRQNLESRQDNPENRIALEELEKSIVARLAEEVTIGIHGRKIRLVITGKR